MIKILSKMKKILQTKEEPKYKFWYEGQSRLVSKDNKKFWEIEQMGRTITILHGKIGTAGKSSKMEMENKEAAIVTAKKLTKLKFCEGGWEWEVFEGIPAEKK